MRSYTMQNGNYTAKEWVDHIGSVLAEHVEHLVGKEEALDPLRFWTTCIVTAIALGTHENCTEDHCFTEDMVDEIVEMIPADQKKDFFETEEEKEGYKMYCLARAFHYENPNEMAVAMSVLKNLKEPS